jgi:hypothetical protein
VGGGSPSTTVEALGWAALTFRRLWQSHLPRSLDHKVQWSNWGRAPRVFLLGKNPLDTHSDGAILALHQGRRNACRR